MPAFLTPDGKNRIVVDRVISYGDGKMICELQGQFFDMGGRFLEDMSIAEKLVEPYRARAIAFVTKYRAAKAQEEARPKPEPQPEPVPTHVMSPELRAVLDVRTSEERAQGGDR